LVEIGPVVLEKKSKMSKIYRQTDGQTDVGQRVIRIAHLSFQLRWAKNYNSIIKEQQEQKQIGLLLHF
jgi:hypothetical protein